MQLAYYGSVFELDTAWWPAETSKLLREECDALFEAGKLRDRAQERVTQVYERVRVSAERSRFNETRIALSDADAAACWQRKYTLTPAIRMVRAWLANPRPFLILLGGVGCGKTFAAATVLREHGGRYLVPDQLSEWLHPRRPSRDEPAPKACASTGPIVVLDDLGTESDPRFGAAFFELVNGRTGREHRTILTGNLTRDSLRERYDARVLDRLRAGAELVEVAGASLRKAVCAL